MNTQDFETKIINKISIPDEILNKYDDEQLKEIIQYLLELKIEENFMKELERILND